MSPADFAAALGQGRCVIANASRTVVAEARRWLAPVIVVAVTAAAETLAARLARPRPSASPRCPRRSLTACRSPQRLPPAASSITPAASRGFSYMRAAWEAQFLEQPVSRPVLQSDSVDVDAADVPIQHSITLFSGDRVRRSSSPITMRDAAG